MSRQLDVVADVTSRCNLRCVMCYFSNVDQVDFPPFEERRADGGLMPISTFQEMAQRFLPRTRKLTLGCATEPLLHPQLGTFLATARTHGIPRVQVQTNLLPLSQAVATAIVESGVTLVAVSIDATEQETYERIRQGSRWEQLLSRLDLLRETAAQLRRTPPRLRVVFTWMRDNLDELARLPAFAASIGAAELDVRYVVPTTGVDNSQRLLDGIAAERRSDLLLAAAREAVARGLRLASWPEMPAAPTPTTLVDRIRQRAWLLRAGIDGLEPRRRAHREQRDGCALPGQEILVRPNGTVQPCTFWADDPIGRVSDDEDPLASPDLSRIRHGLREAAPIGSCRDCDQRRDAFYRPALELPTLAGS